MALVTSWRCRASASRRMTPAFTPSRTLVASQSAAIAAGIRCHLYTGSYAIAGDAPLQTRDPAGALPEMRPCRPAIRQAL